jgi:SAM-dependent methyltransferase
MLSKSEIEILRSWDRAAPYFRKRYASKGKEAFRFKDRAFCEIYAELIKQTMKLLGRPLILKTDLWNEGIEDGRSLVEYAQGDDDSAPICMDICRYVCESANRLKNSDFEPIRGTLLAPPFRSAFDLILDVSTVDHMPKNLRKLWLSSEGALLRPGGILLMSFDCRLNLFNEIYHRVFTRKVYPEWTLAPSEIRTQLKALDFKVLREHALFIAGLFWGTHQPLFPLAGVLRHGPIFELLKHSELSNHSRWLSFVAPQYVIVARKKA